MSKKELLSKMLISSGINYLYRKTFFTGIGVLMYHGVVKDDDDIANGNWLQVRESEFRRQMEHLKEYYDVVPLHHPIHGSGKKPLVAITFDDGYVNNYNVAYPILKELELPATIFLVTNLIDSDHIMWYDKLTIALHNKLSTRLLEHYINVFKENHPSVIDEKVMKHLNEYWKIKYEPSKKDLETYGYLSMDNIKEMDDSDLISFGSHTHNHEIVTKLSDYEFTLTVLQSIDFLKDKKINNISPIFCYPNGWYEQRHVNILDKGFHEIEGAVTTENKKWGFLKDSLYEIPRIGIGRGLSDAQFQVSVSGFFSNIVHLLKKC